LFEKGRFAMLKPAAIAPPTVSIWPTRSGLKSRIERLALERKTGRWLAVRIAQRGQITTAKILATSQKSHHQEEKIRHFSP
jgi:hypothetical protein